MAYPSTIDSFGATVVDNVTTISASHINDLRTAVVALETELKITTNRPKFLAYNSSQDDNQTGDDTAYKIDVDTEILDTGADFASDTFTAPVTGAYLLWVQCSLRGLAAANHTRIELSIVTSNRTYLITVVEVDSILYVTEYLLLSGCCIADMDAADEAYAQVAVYGNSKSVDVQATNTKFGGALLL